MNKFIVYESIELFLIDFDFIKKNIISVIRFCLVKFNLIKEIKYIGLISLA